MEGKTPDHEIRSVEEPSVSTTPLEAKTSSRLTDDFWLWEIGGVVGSLACLLGIVFFLRAFDDQPAPPWSIPVSNGGGVMGLNVGLNSVLSILSTVAKIFVLIPITKGIGQLKWLWFSERERSVEDMETFDSAARGVGGSALLLWTTKFRHFAAFAAFAMIISVAWDPFIQNLVKYSVQYGPIAGDRFTSDQEAYMAGQIPETWMPSLIAIATRYSRQSSLLSDSEVSGLQDMDPWMKSYTYDSTFDTYHKWMTTDALCTTGNCTFPVYLSMAFSPKCTNVTDRLNLNFDQSSGIEISLPDGLSLRSAARDDGTRENIFGITSKFEPLVYKDYSAPALVRFQSIMAINDTLRIETKKHAPLPIYSVNRNSRFEAYECMIIPVVQGWKVSANTVNQDQRSTESGEPQLLSEYTLLKEFEVAEIDSASQDIIMKPPSPLNLLNVTRDSDVINHNITFSISAATFDSLGGWLGTIFSGYAAVDGMSWKYVPVSGANSTGGFAPDAFQATFYNLFQGSFYPEVCPPFLESDPMAFPTADFRCTMTTLTRAISNAMNNFATANVDSADRMDFSMVYGTTFVPKTWVRVQWFWLIIPVLLWAMAIVILVVTIYKTGQAGIRTWRDNPLPMLFLDIDERERREVREHGLTEGGIAKKAKALKLTLAMDEHHAQLVKKENSSAS